MELKIPYNSNLKFSCRPVTFNGCTRSPLRPEVKSVSEEAAVSEKVKKKCLITNKMYCLQCIAPMIVAGNERPFRKLKIVKNYLRTTQSDLRSNKFMLLSSEKKHC